MSVEIVINLFRKIITSLSCIEKLTDDNDLKNEAMKYMLDFIIQYKNVIETNDIQTICFKYNEDDLIDFSYKSIENKENDLVRLGEDVQFGVIELNKILMKR